MKLEGNAERKGEESREEERKKEEWKEERAYFGMLLSYG